MARKTKAQKKVSRVMRESQSGKLRTGKPGPGKGGRVTSRKQAIAIALSEAGVKRPARKGR